MSSAQTAPIAAEAFIDQIQSADADIRYTAWRSAGTQLPSAVAPLAGLLESPDKGIAKAAKGALETLVYESSPGDRERADAIADELAKVAADHARSRPVRAEVIHLIGFVAHHLVVPDLAVLLDDLEVRDEARMALERIPGHSSLNALKNAARLCIDPFRAHLDQSINNRAFTPETVGREPRSTEGR